MFGLRFVFVARRGSRPIIAVYAAFVGVLVESVIIDSDHWRHYFLLLGVLWGLMAASRPYLTAAPAAMRGSIRGAPA